MRAFVFLCKLDVTLSQTRPFPGPAASASASAAFLSTGGATPGQSRQAQCWPSGICACTDATWRPHPAHVGLPQVPHFTW